MANPITQSLTIKGSASDLYQVWKNFDVFPRFMENIKSVTKTGERSSHWVMEGPLGTTIEWDAETTRLDENQRIAWSSKDLSAVKTSGQVTFNELSPVETEVTVTLHYDPPAGLAGEVAAQLFGNPEGRLRDDLRRFKEYIESTPERIHAQPTAS